MIRYIAFRAAQLTAIQLPRLWAYKLGVIVGLLAYLLLRDKRKALCDNLAHVKPELNSRDLSKLCRENMKLMAKAYVDLMLLPRYSPQAIAKFLSFQGDEYLEQAKMRGKGVIIASVHMGSWEIAAAGWASLHGNISMLAEELDPPQLFKWYKKTRSRMGIRVYPLNRSGLMALIRDLKNGGIVIIAVDRDITGNGTLFNFFGKTTKMPIGAAVLALKTGASILPVYIVRKKDNDILAVGTEPINPKSSGNYQDDVKNIMEQLLNRMEGFIQKHPEQWHVPHPIWR